MGRDGEQRASDAAAPILERGAVPTGTSEVVCRRCHAQSSAEHRFCWQCGACLALVCPSCRRSVPSGEQFCRHCGILLLHAPREGLACERKRVTVLFADLKGSMELLADRDPEEARRLLDPVLERMMDAVHRYGGTVNQVMGDGIMALFGAPLAHEDHAVRACYAALRMRDSIAEYSAVVLRSHGVPVQMRLGLNSGEVVVRAIGSDLRMDYTAVGQTTHLAARMEQMATPGTILLARSTFRLAEGYVQVEARGPVAVRGLSSPVDVYALIGARRCRTRLHAAADRGLTRFVGRTAELDELRRALALAHDGHGQLVAIVGEAGVGKSRFVYEVTRAHQAQGWYVLEASSVSYGKATNYLPVIDLLRTYFKVHDRETHHEIREKVTQRLRVLDPSLEPILPALLTLLDVPIEDLDWQGLDPAARRRRTLEAIRRLVLRQSQERPLLVVFEDLHWIDAETQAVLDELVESLAVARILLLVNYRPEYRHAWEGKAHYRGVRLEALPPENTGELLSALLGDDPALKPLKRLLVKRGNPFFIEESIRTLVETGALALEHGSYRPTRPIEDIEVPATVQAILAARIDRLPPEEKQLLQTAAVVGKNVPLGVLHAVAEHPPEAIHRALTRLQVAGFLYETRLFPDPEYTFKHALTHEVTYGTLLQERRKTLHARLVDVIERGYPDRLAEHVERLAHHAVRGERWERAVTYLRQAGAKALARSANREAVACFEQALSALRHRPEARDTLEQAVDLRFDLRTALHPLGEFERILGCLREAEGLARRLGDRRRLGQMCAYMCHNLWMTGHPTEALRFGEDAQAIGESLEYVPLQVTGKLYLGAAHLWTGDYARARELLLRVLHLLEGERRGERFGLPGFPAVMARCYLTLIAVDRGAFDEGIAHAREAVRLAEALDHPYSLTFGCWVLAHVHISRGDLASAFPLLERGLTVSREWNLTSFLTNETGTLGYAHACAGRIAEGLPLIEHALGAAEIRGHGNLLALFLSYLAEAHVLAGRFEEADEYARRALAFARERGQRGHEACALRLLGEASAGRERPIVAEAQYREALALAEGLGMWPVAAHCHLGLGKVYRLVDRRREADEHLAIAWRMYREMDMSPWSARAEAELRAGGSAILLPSGRTIIQELAHEQPRTPLLRPRANPLRRVDPGDAGGDDAPIRRVPPG
jgi:class 3 adenylate cyclase/tetratricopeptide (TPR) repeat protein